MGTLLHQQGVDFNTCFDYLNIDQPATVADIHRAYIEALREAGCTGFVALEYEAAEDEKTGVPKSVEFMNYVMEGF